jgi:hypothetical protein
MNSEGLETNYGHGNGGKPHLGLKAGNQAAVRCIFNNISCGSRFNK